MPFVNVKITTGATAGQKEELIEKMTQVLVDVLGKNPASTHVVIEEVPPESWGVGGRSVAKLRAAGSGTVSAK
ncbi:MAG: tautomerase [Desulfuromonas sp.]|nr:MAG: tautomerase [Desulfuromonas sp.]